MRQHALVAATGLLFAGAAHAITIEWDYTYDTARFFTAEHRSVMDAVASEFGARITDSLAPITSNGINEFRPQVDLIPGAGEGNTGLGTVQSIGADTLRVFVGSSPLSGNTLGIGGAGGFDASGTQAFVDTIAKRGQTEPESQNFSTWGGAIVFDNSSDTDWYVDSDVSTVENFSGQFDFYSIVAHELGHVLGVGTSSAWTADVSGATFTGAAAVSEFGRPVPLAGSGNAAGHLNSSVESTFMGQPQDAALSPSIQAGTRKYYTDLDWALLEDVGWEIAPVAAIPEAHTWAMMLAGLGLLGWRTRQRRV